MAERPVALITGTSRGIGGHLARHFLARDWQVVGCSRSEYDGIDDERYRHHAVDVGDEEQVVEMFRSIRRDGGRLDVAVNNAVRNPSPAHVALTRGAGAQTALNVNVLGALLVCRESIKLMMRRRHGRIVNIGSMASRNYVAGGAVYTACKAAVDAMTPVIAREVASYGITCNVLAPAAVPTERAAAVDSELGREMLSRNAIQEMGSMEDVSAAIDWLVSDEAAAVTGQVVYLGGA